MSDQPSTYMDLVEILEARIYQGAASGDPNHPYAPGKKIPTGAKLAEEFGLHYTTVAKAIAILKDRSLLIGRPPRGVYVA